MSKDKISEAIDEAMGEKVKLELPLVAIAMIGRMMFKAFEDDDSDIAQKLIAKTVLEELAEVVKGTDNFKEFMKKQEESGVKGKHGVGCTCDEDDEEEESGHVHVIKISLKKLLGL